MARKNLLTGLMGSAQLPAGNSGAGPTLQGGASPPQAPHFGLAGTRGAIGAVTRSIEQLKAQAIVEIAPDLVDASFISDRLDGSTESHDELVASIRDHGQQVPILLRPHPEKEGRYQIAYGRRRLKAVAELGRRVRAVVKPLTDDQLVVAQGQENSARTDLSFIEKALFAARLEEGGFSRDTIMAALSVDKTGLSRLISSAIKIPREIIEAIGPAPRAGRDRWIELSTRLERAAALGEVRALIAGRTFATTSSDDRFNQVFEAVASKKSKLPRPTVCKADDGTRVARIKDDERNLTVIIDKNALGGFGTYLVASLPEIYAAFKRHEER
jgi:ParB family transcriptional regulator, chromosome partitioning protein